MLDTVNEREAIMERFKLSKTTEVDGYYYELVDDEIWLVKIPYDTKVVEIKSFVDRCHLKWPFCRELKVIGGEGLKSCKNLFSGYDRDSLDLSEFNPSQATDMSGMFFDCPSLVSLDLSNLDTSKVTNMSGMFCECKALVALDLSSFDTSSVTNMNGMFCECEALEALDLSSFDTSSVTDMNSMFLWCESLTTLDLSNFDTSSVTNMSTMFYECKCLSNLDLSGFDTSQVKDMTWMFRWCNPNVVPEWYDGEETSENGTENMRLF